jgi:uncharacterized repeat protein (TIGR01451 family)
MNNRWSVGRLFLSGGLLVGCILLAIIIVPGGPGVAGVMTLALTASWLLGVGAARFWSGGSGALTTLLGYAGLTLGAVGVLVIYVGTAVVIGDLNLSSNLQALTAMFIPTLAWLVGYYAVGDNESPTEPADARSKFDQLQSLIPDRPATTDRTGRWSIAVSMAILIVGTGILTGRQSLILSGLVPTLFAAFASLSAETVAHPSEIAVQRQIDDDTPVPGEIITVTLTVSNEGQTTASDVRIIDGVPEGLPVVEGSPRFSARLAPGESVSFSYAIRGIRGYHKFDPACVISSDLAGARERIGESGARMRVAVRATVETVPEPITADQPAGQLPTDQAGSGVEFHSIRDYQPGDPLNRVEWNHFAETGELATVSFREHRSSTAILVVDTRSGPAYGSEDLVARSAYAAAAMSGPMLERGESVGAHRFPDGEWLEPARGGIQRRRLTAILDRSDPVGAPDIESAKLPDLLPGDAHVYLCSPCTDDQPIEFCRRLRTHAIPVTVVCPKPIESKDVVGSMSDLRRTVRLTRLRERGAKIVDWSPSDPLEIALREAL